MTQQFLGRTPRPQHQLTLAVGALTRQHVLGAADTEGALKRADARIGRRRRQGAVTALAVGPQLQHSACSAGLSQLGDDLRLLKGAMAHQAVVAIREQARHWLVREHI